MKQGDKYSATARTNGVSEGDTTTVYVYLGWIQLQLLQNRYGGAAEGLIDFEEIHIFLADTFFVEALWNPQDGGNKQVLGIDPR